jgi:hypothetical protein
VLDERPVAFRVRLGLSSQPFARIAARRIPDQRADPVDGVVGAASRSAGLMNDSKGRPIAASAATP